MRHFWVICLVLMLPIQGAWSLAAKLCLHESQSQASHWGHHQHAAHAGDTSEYQQHDQQQIPVDHDDHLAHYDSSQLPQAVSLTTPSAELERRYHAHAPPLYQPPAFDIPTPPSRVAVTAMHGGVIA